jgi:L-ascorbate metabolism protein UlaG (beta-lactamase superfamily)
MHKACLRWLAAIVTCFAVLAAHASVHAAPSVSRCLAVSQGPLQGPSVGPSFGQRPDGGLQRVSLGGPLGVAEVRLTFVGHSTFLIESAAGVRAVTDYNDYVRPDVVPDVATMNRAHTTHYTDSPDPRIAHVLRGWNPAGGPVRHDIEVRDLHVRNVPTNIRDWGSAGTVSYGNSIFIFEIAGLCIGHLGHLHHTLTPEQLAAIGQLDVVLVPVDGGYTMDIAGMVEVVRTLRARLIIPMHYFNQNTLARFIDRMKAEFPVETATDSEILLSARLLPAEPKILVLPGR